jgi:hypothetical protein
VIISSLGAIYTDSLKRLTSISELSPAQTVRIGQRLSDAAITRSHAIWKQHQQEIAKMSPPIEISGTTSEVEDSLKDFSDYEKSPEDTEEDNSHNQTIVIDCAPGELNVGKAGVAEIAHADQVLRPIYDPDEYANLIENEDDTPMIEGECDLPEEKIDPASILASPSEIESPPENWDSPLPPELLPKRIPLSEIKEVQQRQIHEREEQQQQLVEKWKPPELRKRSTPQKGIRRISKIPTIPDTGDQPNAAREGNQDVELNHPCP